MSFTKNNAKLLVAQILDGNLLDANLTLTSLVTEAQKERERRIRKLISEADGDDLSETGELTEDDVKEETDEEGEEETIDTDGIDEPTDGDPNLGDNLDSGIEDTSVSEAEMIEMGNDVVEIDCEINQKIISKLYDKISNLKTILNSKDMNHDEREYITLETKLSYYGDKLEKLQSKTNPAIDQSKVEDRISKIEAALATLESEIGSADEMEDIKDTASAGELENTTDDTTNAPETSTNEDNEDIEVDDTEIGADAETEDDFEEKE